VLLIRHQLNNLSRTSSLGLIVITGGLSLGGMLSLRACLAGQGLRRASPRE
jgi:hypothetical protein